MLRGELRAALEVLDRLEAVLVEVQAAEVGQRVDVGHMVVACSRRGDTRAIIKSCSSRATRGGECGRESR